MDWLLIPSWISNYMPSKVWHEITYPFPNLHCWTTEVWKWINVFIPNFTMYELLIHARIIYSQLQHLNHMGMDKKSHPAHYNGCIYLSHQVVVLFMIYEYDIYAINKCSTDLRHHCTYWCPRMCYDISRHDNDWKFIYIYIYFLPSFYNYHWFYITFVDHMTSLIMPNEMIWKFLTLLVLTHHGLLMSYGDRYWSQHWLW